MYLHYSVYAYLRKDGMPYYIGKGKRKRAWEKYNSHIKVPPDLSRIIIIESNLTDVGACAIERRLIRWYGRKDNGTGILRNLTDGGDGTSGRKHRPETIEKIRLGNTGKTISAEHCQRISLSNTGKTPWNKGITGIVKYSEETKQKMSNSAKKPKSDQHKQNMRKPKITSTCPHCNKTGGHGNMLRYHYDNCKSLIID